MHRLITDFVQQLGNQPILQRAAFPAPIDHHMDDLLLRSASNTADADATTLWCLLNMGSKLINQLAAILHPTLNEEARDSMHT